MYDILSFAYFKTCLFTCYNILFSQFFCENKLHAKMKVLPVENSDEIICYKIVYQGQNRNMNTWKINRFIVNGDSLLITIVSKMTRQVVSGIIMCDICRIVCFHDEITLFICPQTTRKFSYWPSLGLSKERF